MKKDILDDLDDVIMKALEQSCKDQDELLRKAKEITNE